jgi:hypothetical protein
MADSAYNNPTEPSCPHSLRASTSYCGWPEKDVDGRNKSGHDDPRANASSRQQMIPKKKTLIPKSKSERIRRNLRRADVDVLMPKDYDEIPH